MASTASVCYTNDVKLTRTEAGFVVEVPDDVVAALGLREGDPVMLGKFASEAAVDPAAPTAAIDIFRQLAQPLPAGYRFDREEANAR